MTSRLDEIAARKGFYYQTSYDPETADSAFVMPMTTAERDALVAAVRAGRSVLIAHPFFDSSAFLALENALNPLLRDSNEAD